MKAAMARKWAVCVLAAATGLVVATAASAQQQAPQANQMQKAQPPEQAPQAQPAGPADATSANIEVIVLHATNADGGVSIDPSIGKIQALTKPPFSAYNKYTLISRTAYAVSKTSPAKAPLPNDRILQVALKDILNGNRYRIDASVNNPIGQQQQRGAAFLPLLEVTTPAGEPFFVAGQTYQGGILVIGIKVLK
jgi:hypothetical protein